MHWPRSLRGGGAQARSSTGRGTETPPGTVSNLLRPERQAIPLTRADDSVFWYHHTKRQHIKHLRERLVFKGGRPEMQLTPDYNHRRHKGKQLLPVLHQEFLANLKAPQAQGRILHDTRGPKC